MKCRIPSRQDEIRKITEQVVKDKIYDRARDETTRRVIKIMCLALNEKYGFGRQRCAQTISWMTDIINEELDSVDNDSGDFWFKIDTELKRKNLSFFPFEDEISNNLKNN